LPILTTKVAKAAKERNNMFDLRALRALCELRGYVEKHVGATCNGSTIGYQLLAIGYAYHPPTAP
jgi:hypothetical protein